MSFEEGNEPTGMNTSCRSFLPNIDKTSAINFPFVGRFKIKNGGNVVGSCSLAVGSY